LAKTPFNKINDERKRNVYGCLFWIVHSLGMALYQDYHLHDYDNPANFSHKYKMFVPFYVSNYRESAHYLEINKIVFEEMWKRFLPVKDQIENEFNNSSEKVKRTKYCMNPNYVYEAFGWELNKTD
jgi:hypothetical protein